MFFLLPDPCPLCDDPQGWPCSRCAGRLPFPPALPVPTSLDSLAVVLGYDGDGRRLITSVKYANRRSPLDWMAEELCGRLRGGPFDCVTWVPASAKGRRDRGFDVARLLARRIGLRLGVRHRRLLVRIDRGRQSVRSKVERLEGPRLRAVTGAGRWSSVLLVDDVCTTGASLTTAAVELRREGTAVVCGAVAARTPDHFGRLL